MHVDLRDMGITALQQMFKSSLFQKIILCEPVYHDKLVLIVVDCQGVLVLAYAQECNISLVLLMNALSGCKTRVVTERCLQLTPQGAHIDCYECRFTLLA